jgi:hypothetical protein
MLLAASLTSNPREATLKPSTRQEVFGGANDYRTQRPRSRLEALFVSADVTVKVRFEQLIKSSALGMSRMVLRRGFGNSAASSILIRRPVIWLECERPKDDRLMPEGHGRQ